MREEMFHRLSCTVEVVGRSTRQMLTWKEMAITKIPRDQVRGTKILCSAIQSTLDPCNLKEAAQSLARQEFGAAANHSREGGSSAFMHPGRVVFDRLENRRRTGGPRFGHVGQKAFLNLMVGSQLEMHRS